MGTSNRGSQQLDSQSTAGQTPKYATFNSTNVLICGYPDDEVSALARCIEQEGGKVLKKYYKTARPDVIVCGTVADRNCKVGAAVVLSCCCSSPLPATSTNHKLQEVGSSPALAVWSLLLWKLHACAGCRRPGGLGRMLFLL